MRPPDAEALISEESFEHEEFLPYWAELWSSAVALAHDVSLRSLRGKPTLELGCGLGLPSIAAALRRRARARHRLVARRGARHGGQRRAATASRSRRSSARGPSRTRSWSARRGRSCSPATCSTSAATSSSCSTCCRGSSTRPASCCWPTPAACRPSASWRPRPSAAGRCDSIASPRAPRVLIHRLRRIGWLDDGEVVAAAGADLVGDLKGGLEKRGGTALAGGAAGRADARHDRQAARARSGRLATSRMRSAMRAAVVASCTPAHTAASRSSSSWPTRSSGLSAEAMWRPSSRSTTLVPGRPRSSTIRSSPSIRITITPRRARARRVQCPGEPVEQREAGGQAGGRVDLGRGLRLGADDVEPAGDPLNLGGVARDEGGLDGAPAAAGGEQPVLHGLGARAAHPAAVERHHALAVLGVDQRLNGASQKRLARHAGQLGDERRGVQERAGGVMDGDERAHAAREQPEALLPRVLRETAAVDSLQMPLWDAHLPLIGGGRTTLSAAGRPERGTAPGR